MPAVCTGTRGVVHGRGLRPGQTWCHAAMVTLWMHRSGCRIPAMPGKAKRTIRLASFLRFHPPLRRLRLVWRAHRSSLRSQASGASIREHAIQPQPVVLHLPTATTTTLSTSWTSPAIGGGNSQKRNQLPAGRRSARPIRACRKGECDRPRYVAAPRGAVVGPRCAGQVRTPSGGCASRGPWRSTAWFRVRGATS